MERESVMIACPINQDAEKYLDRYIGGIESLDYKNWNLFFCDNSKDNKFFGKLCDTGYTAVKVKDEGEWNKNILSSYNRLRESFLDKEIHNFDWMLILESDVVPNPSLLKEFMRRRHPVMGCPYKLNSKMMMINTFTPWGRNENITVEDYLTKYQHLSYERVWSCGFGCIIIKNWVVESTPFRISEKGKCVDTAFAEDMLKKDIPIYCKMDMPANHLRVKS